MAVSEIGRVTSGARRVEVLMTKAVQKITLSPSGDTPFDKLMLNQPNVRRIKAGVSVEALAEGIARCGLLQSLSVRPVLNEGGTETGKFEIPACGRRFQALSLLVKQKRLAKTMPVPCIVRNAVGVANIFDAEFYSAAICLKEERWDFTPRLPTNAAAFAKSHD